MIYCNEKYNKYDIQKAIKYLSDSSSDARNRRAQYQLAKIYFEGKSIARNIDKAIEYFSKAADQERLEISGEILDERGIMPILDVIKKAHFNLGLIYYEGKYVTQDIKKAIHFLDYAEKNDYTYSQYLLGLIYITGDYIEQDITKAIDYFNKAAKKKMIRLLYSLLV